MKVKHRWLGWIIGGTGAALALYAVLKRIAAEMNRPKPDLCAGYESGDLHCVNVGMTTVYLLKGEEGYLVIDTGFARDYPKFRDELAREGIELDEIKALLLTHGHDDHAGFAARLIEETGARLLVHRRSLPLLSGKQKTGADLHSLNARIFVLALLYSLVTQRDLEYPPVIPGENDVILEGDDAQVLRALGFDAEVIATPGHSEDSISVVTPGGRVFCGDAAMNSLKITGAQHRPIFIRDEEQVYQSWAKMVEHGAEVLYPSHGAPFTVENLARSLEKFGGSNG